MSYAFDVCNKYTSRLSAWLSGLNVGLWLANIPLASPDLWLTRDRFVGIFRYESTNQANSAFYPFGVGVVIHVITWIMRTETIKRHTFATCGCFVARSKSRVRAT